MGKTMNWTMVMVAMLGLSGSMTLAGSAAVVPVLKTGQTISFVPGDDGTYQMGMSWPNPRFTVGTNAPGMPNDTNCVTDLLTGLMWARNGNLPGKLMIWKDAVQFCKNASYGGYSDWRLPNVRESQSVMLYASGKIPAFPFPLATPAWGLYYWTSTDNGDAKRAFVAILHTGGTKFLEQSTSQAVWMVRGGTTPANGLPIAKTGQTKSYMAGDDGATQLGVAWPNPRFTVGTNAVGTPGDTNCVTDNLTGLMWARNGNIPDADMDWSNAVRYCATHLNVPPGYGGYTDWRLPNVLEALSVLDLSGDKILSISLPAFFDKPAWGDGYWTSTLCGSSPNAQAHFIYPRYHSGGSYVNPQTRMHSFWAVRGGNK